MQELPDIEILRASLECDPETGKLTFKSRPNARGCWNARHAGKPALHTLNPDGYCRGFLFSRMTLAHRVAFAFYTGRTDFGFIDHINGDRSDNRKCNLREVSRLENALNKAKPRNSTTGHVGVHKVAEGVWRSHICIGNKTKHLGRFKNIADAIAARKAAERDLGFHENHGREQVGAAA